MTSDDSTFPAEPDNWLPADLAEFGTWFEKYEQILHDDPNLTPEQFLFDQCPSALRQELDDIYEFVQAIRPAREESPAAVLPDAVPGYEVLEELGRGGMGIVYKARHSRLKRVVALKVLLAGAHAGPDARARFHREAETAARLQHPNIVPIHDVGEHDSRPYLALEYVDGGNLAQRLEGTPQKPLAAARLVERLARAIHHAHQQGVIHRDLKPANVLLQRGDGGDLDSAVPRITDFGLAKWMDGAADTATGELTQTGAIVGTLSYMAPEQAEGKKEITAAVDVYALGAILYELLTGRPPFKAETPSETLRQVQHDEPVPPRRLQPKLPRDLETICLKCLHKEPHKRYATAEDLADDLQRFQEGEPIRARPTGMVERGSKWARRYPALAAVAGVVMAAVLLVVGLWAWYSWALKQAAEGEHRKAVEAATQQALAVAHLQNALDVLEPLSFLIKGEARARGKEGEFFRNRFCQHASGLYQKLLADKDNPDPQVQRQIGRAFHGLGMTHSLLQQSEMAETAFRQAAVLQERLVQEFPTQLDYRADLALTYQSLGDEYADRGEKQNAGDYYEKLTNVFQSFPHGNSRVAGGLAQLSQKLWLMGRQQEALRWNDHVIEDMQTVMRQETQPERRVQAGRGLAGAYFVRGLLLKQMGKPAQALEFLDRGLQLEEANLPPANTLEIRNQRFHCEWAIAEQRLGFSPSVVDLLATGARHQAATPWMLALHSTGLSTTDGEPKPSAK